MFASDWRFWFGLAASAGFLAVLVYRADLGELQESLRSANYIYVAPAIALYFGALYFRALRWRYLLSPMGSFKVARLYPVVVIGYMVNNVAPARLGELARSYLLSRREDCSASAALATVTIERVFDGLTLLAFAALAAPWLLALGLFQGYGDISQSTAAGLAAATVCLFAVGLLVLTLLARQTSGHPVIDFGLRLVPGARGKERVQNLLNAFIQGLGVLNSPRKHLALLLLSLPVWLLEGSMYYLVGYSFGLDEYFSSIGRLILVALLVTATSNLVGALPTSIGGIGPFELVAQQTLVSLGVGASLAGAYGAFLHLAALWLPVNLVGLGLLWHHSLSFGGLVQRPVPEGEADDATAALDKAGNTSAITQPESIRQSGKEPS